MSAEYQAKQAALVAEHIKKQDIVITTALIPGRPAPRLVSAAMVASMKPGSVIVDLAVERGGNVEGAKPGEVVEAGGVKIIGYLNVPGRIAASASALYAAQPLCLRRDADRQGERSKLAVNWDDELVKATILTRDGAIVHPAFAGKAAREAAMTPNCTRRTGRRRSAPQGRGRRRRATPPAPAQSLSPTSSPTAPAMPPTPSTGGAIDPFVFRLSIFVLAIFVGYYVVWSVTPALHTPLMSVTNAISTVIVVGALLAVGVAPAAAWLGLARAFGFVALILASVNIFGGFLVTQRMLAMYKRREAPTTKAAP